MHSGKPNQDVISKRLLCKINILQQLIFLPAGRQGPLASRGPYARAYRAYRLMRPWTPVL